MSLVQHGAHVQGLGGVEDRRGANFGSFSIYSLEKLENFEVWIYF